MEHHTISLLQECSQGCKMGIKSMNQVIEYVKESDLRKLIDHSKDEHEKIESEIEQMLAWHGLDSKNPEMMASAMSWIGTEMKMMMHDDDKQAAKIMMDGCNMGIQSISGFLNQYSGASQSSIALAKRLVEIEEQFRDGLKAFV